MSQQSIHLLRDEALRLIELTQKILADMCEVPGLLTHEESELTQTLDKKSATARINILEGEKHKLKTLDMVLAVVGTMKAGKSTTINAIIGTEVLPNRNAPMTAIPTLIRHTPGQIEPQLTLNNIEPIEKTRLAIRKKLEASKRNGDFLERIKQTDKDLYELAIIICDNVKPRKQHTGSSAIFSFLKGINDLVRLAPLVDVEFPFDAYSDVESLPIICVQFAHLNSIPEKSGTLTLLDTPGPNEAGQNRLRPMLKEQLRKASAVLAVLDYTQLKSDADAQIREDLAEISDVTQGRLFALVNKFDQKDSNGMGADDVIDFVQGMMQRDDAPTINKHNIFPVSSKRAYLAGRARQLIKQTGKIPSPDHKNPTWVNDFCAAAFGNSWDEDEDYLDPNEFQKKAEKLWKNSRFENPIENVICMAHSNAAVIAVASATKKIISTADALHNICTIRDISIKKQTSELQKLVTSLQEDIETIDACEKAASNQQSKMLLNFNDTIKKELDSVKKSTHTEVETYLAEGKIKGDKIAAMAAEKTKNSTQSPLLSLAETLIKSFISPLNPTEQHFKEGSKEINFRQDKKSAEDLIKNIEATIGNIIAKTNKIIELRLESLLANFEKNFQAEVIDAASTIMKSLEKKMGAEGFAALTIKLPERTTLALNLSSSRMLSDAIESKSRTEKIEREQSGIWGGTKRFFGGLFGAKWGIDESNIQVIDYKVNIEKIKSHVDMAIQESFNGLADGLRMQVDQPLKIAADEFFATFRGTIEGIRGDLQQSVEDKSKNHATQQSIIDYLNHLKKKLPAQIADANALSADVKTFMETATA